jgi:hypothetical protein
MAQGDSGSQERGSQDNGVTSATGPDGTEEIVVTARRRAEPVQAGFGGDAIRALAEAVTGAGLPTLYKPPVLGSVPYTSPLSKALHDLGLGKIKTGGIRTPFLGHLGARSGSLAGVLGRTLPIVGAIALTVDVASSQNPARTAVGDLSGVAGAAVGATLGSAFGPVGAFAGAIIGSYVGEQLGLWVYDFVDERRSYVPSR